VAGGADVTGYRGARALADLPRGSRLGAARAVAAPPAGDSPDPLAGLLGPGRAAVLRELGRPATSTQLALALSVSLGTVSAHLAVLRETGVVARSRIARNVVYRLTPRGEQLLSLLGPDEAS
jgi:DNA-binding transcriptional ArsR family regulator